MKESDIKKLLSDDYNHHVIIKSVVREDGNSYKAVLSPKFFSVVKMDAVKSDDIQQVYILKPRIIEEEKSEYLPGLLNFLAGKKKKVKSFRKEIDLVHTYNISYSDRKEKTSLKLEDIKDIIDKAFDHYDSYVKAKKDLKSWDGILSDDPKVKKALMRDVKISELLNRDTSKLEKFLDSDG